MTAAALKPCPFCGGTAEYDEWRGVVKCRKCLVETDCRMDLETMGYVREYAEEIWNRRAERKGDEG